MNMPVLPIGYQIERYFTSSRYRGMQDQRAKISEELKSISQKIDAINSTSFLSRLFSGSILTRKKLSSQKVTLENHLIELEKGLATIGSDKFCRRRIFGVGIAVLLTSIVALHYGLVPRLSSSGNTETAPKEPMLNNPPLPSKNPRLVNNNNSPFAQNPPVPNVTVAELSFSAGRTEDLAPNSTSKEPTSNVTVAELSFSASGTEDLAPNSTSKEPTSNVTLAELSFSAGGTEDLAPVESWLQRFLTIPKNNQTQSDAEAAVKADPRLMFQHVRQDLQTRAMSEMAIKADYRNFWHVKDKNSQITQFAMSNSPEWEHWFQLLLFRLFKMNEGTFSSS